MFINNEIETSIREFTTKFRRTSESDTMRLMLQVGKDVLTEISDGGSVTFTKKDGEPRSYSPFMR